MVVIIKSVILIVMMKFQTEESLKEAGFAIIVEVVVGI